MRLGMLVEEAAVALVTLHPEVDVEMSAGKSDSVAAGDKPMSKRPKSGPRVCNIQKRDDYFPVRQILRCASMISFHVSTCEEGKCLLWFL